MNPLIIIPARLASTRLPNKPLADIHGEPMIVHVWRRAIEAEIGEVLVAASDESIAAAITAVGGQAILTDPHLPSGSDRIWQALERVDPLGHYDTIINLQGDLPTIDPALIQAVLAPLDDSWVDISTLAAVIKNEEEIYNPNVVKAVLTPVKGSDNIFRSLYFTRAASPHGAGPHYHHIGIYAYKREALSRFVSLPPSRLEKQEKLEQLRALEDDMAIQVCIVDTIPLGVDTFEDLQKARQTLQPVHHVREVIAKPAPQEKSEVSQPEIEQTPVQPEPEKEPQIVFAQEGKVIEITAPVVLATEEIVVEFEQEDEKQQEQTDQNSEQHQHNDEHSEQENKKKEEELA